MGGGACARAEVGCETQKKRNDERCWLCCCCSCSGVLLAARGRSDATLRVCPACGGMMSCAFRGKISSFGVVAYRARLPRKQTTRSGSPGPPGRVRGPAAASIVNKIHIFMYKAVFFVPRIYQKMKMKRTWNTAVCCCCLLQVGAMHVTNSRSAMSRKQVVCFHCVRAFLDPLWWTWSLLTAPSFQLLRHDAPTCLF